MVTDCCLILSVAWDNVDMAYSNERVCKNFAAPNIGCGIMHSHHNPWPGHGIPHTPVDLTLHIAAEYTEYSLAHTKGGSASLQCFLKAGHLLCLEDSVIIAC